MKPTAGDETGISEEEIPVLVRRAQAGDGEAFEELLRALGPGLHRHAFFLARNEQQALDLLQETILEVWKHLRRYDGRARFFTWMCKIMLHRHYDWVRRLRSRAFAAIQVTEGLEAAPGDGTIAASQRIEELERAHAMKQCLDRLPAAQREVVYLRFYADESIEGIAAIVRCSPGTVKSRLFHALRRLAKMKQVGEFQTSEV